MKNGISRFEFYLQKVDGMMQQAGKAQNPALWLYTNDARTPFFMLEALGRLHSTLHNKKIFSKLKDRFKLMEDGFGQVDYYDNYGKIFLAHPTVPVHIREYMQAQAREKIQHVNDLLLAEGWLGENNQRLKKIRKKLFDADWLKAKDEAKAIKGFYEEEIKGIVKFVNAAKGNFTDMESHVHELRRDIRWLSIYPQALQGMIQLTDSGKAGPEIQKYLIPEIVNSRYNKMPDAGSNSWFLMLEKSYFLALSWLIAEMGKFKDQGLQVFAVTEALQQTEGLTHDIAYQKSFLSLGIAPESEQQLLTNASAITATFLQEKILDKLLYGLANIRQVKSE